MKKLFIIDAISTFRNRYVVEAESAEHACDEVTMIDSGDHKDHFEPVSQKYLGEVITDTREITKEEYDAMLARLSLGEDTRESSSYWMGDALIRKVDYT